MITYDVHAYICILWGNKVSYDSWQRRSVQQKWYGRGKPAFNRVVMQATTSNIDTVKQTFVGSCGDAKGQTCAW